ncbi:uncharacterized protein Z519_03245 [Cladophialophora bantiana CBS 173.52]|uniref:Uncharacterized protein n=1 Tax=Cladophialophora bantiana (strain ATCC 10958 / CBS 173.52 / CDC B-1940 / NIH 8579) TaxID=1442370 RepID=A0A0D2HRR1_CLAB1|nr:uncharacterized protein Z519_03245 [Cladophialophora bantiana CBS 173.52]KIW96178.1 hypothetical protein Z519_03245 [Cladophialophora bantiana CBS 173.52]
MGCMFSKKVRKEAEEEWLPPPIVFPTPPIRVRPPFEPLPIRLPEIGPNGEPPLRAIPVPAWRRRPADQCLYHLRYELGSDDSLVCECHAARRTAMPRNPRYPGLLWGT